MSFILYVVHETLGLGKTAREATKRLREAHRIREDWAERHGILAPNKYQLIHSTRGGSWDRTPLQLDKGMSVQDVSEVSP
ncbi:hypothetical protein SEPCBS57363_002365 [Sporothrix epigloea]|uniref:Uncharacterized protein n=1 Tax=Sporothrix epigloea TaxID=1892477 RepID=A0ABP0DFG6_9PEZI